MLMKFCQAPPISIDEADTIDDERLKNKLVNQNPLPSLMQLLNTFSQSPHVDEGFVELVVVLVPAGKYI